MKNEAWGTALLAAAVSAADLDVKPSGNSPWGRDGAKLFSAFDGTRKVAAALAKIDGSLGKRALGPDEKARAQEIADLTESVVEIVAAIANATNPAKAEARAKVLAELQAAWKALGEKDYFGASAHVLQGVSLATEEGPVQRNLLRVAALAMDVAAAEGADSVEAALNRFAAPAGSYVGKHRGSRGYFNVNAYFGAFGGREQAKQREGSWGEAEWGWTAGAWAPIGFEGGWSTRYGSFGLFAQVVDLGVLAAYRMAADEDQLASPPAVGFQAVVSPGAYLVWGIRDCPFSVAAGASLTPSLRKVGSAPDEKRDAWRWGVAVGIDIPVFP